mmetsp:Transcript_16003/g.37942  ORF Transcript_16003/g.37942 Transcript_16003/m.37942 type:complete len:211 (-) Transcript_16003:983-1615(-)
MPSSHVVGRGAVPIPRAAPRGRQPRVAPGGAPRVRVAGLNLASGEVDLARAHVQGRPAKWLPAASRLRAVACVPKLRGLRPSGRRLPWLGGGGRVADRQRSLGRCVQALRAPKLCGALLRDLQLVDACSASAGSAVRRARAPARGQRVPRVARHLGEHGRGPGPLPVVDGWREPGLGGRSPEMVLGSPQPRRAGVHLGLAVDSIQVVWLR